MFRRIAKSAVTSRDKGICHICLHPGARVGDHLQPVAERPDLARDPSNIRAAHGYLKNSSGQCPVCSAAATLKAGREVKIYCNELRGMGSVERVRRILRERTGLPIGEVPSSPAGERDW